MVRLAIVRLNAFGWGAVFAVLAYRYAEVSAEQRYMEARLRGLSASMRALSGSLADLPREPVKPKRWWRR